MAKAKFTRSKQLQSKLKALRTATLEPARAGVAEGAEIIVASQKNLAPVKSGALRNSIQWTFGSPPAYASLSLRGKLAANETRAIITAGNSDVRYAHLVEFGSVRAAASPFFFPGYRASKKAAKAAIQRHIAAAVKGAAR